MVYQMKKYLMAIDAGTGSVRAVLFDVEGNQNLVTWMEAAGLLFKRKKQIFFQTPVQKCSDLSGSSYV